jgi:hypothetical protein
MTPQGYNPETVGELHFVTNHFLHALRHEDIPIERLRAIIEAIREATKP